MLIFFTPDMDHKDHLAYSTMLPISVIQEYLLL